MNEGVYTYRSKAGDLKFGFVCFECEPVIPGRARTVNGYRTEGDATEGCRRHKRTHERRNGT